MASQMYRYTKTNLNAGIATDGTKVFEVGMAAESQPMRAYIQKLKVSIIPNRETENISYLVHASSSGQYADQDIITAQAVPNGGGTVWLSVKRTIKDDDFKDDRNDGKVAVWVRASNAPANNVAMSDIMCEAWGKFIDLD